MEAFDDFFGKQHLRVARIAAAFGAFLFERFDFGVGLKAQEVVPIPHQIVRDAHDLAEHIVRAVRDADVVVLTLTHLHHAVESHQKRHRENALGFLIVLALQFAADQEVKALVGAAQFDIGFKSNGVISLHQGVNELMHRDRELLREALCEIVAFQKTRQRIAARQTDEAFGAQRVVPFGVVAHLSLRKIEYLPRLFKVRFRIHLDLFRRQRRTRHVAAGRVTDRRGEVPDQENHRVTQILQLTELI